MYMSPLKPGLFIYGIFLPVSVIQGAHNWANHSKTVKTETEKQIKKLSIIKKNQT